MADQSVASGDVSVTNDDDVTMTGGVPVEVDETISNTLETVAECESVFSVEWIAGRPLWICAESCALLVFTSPPPKTGRVKTTRELILEQLAALDRITDKWGMSSDHIEQGVKILTSGMGK